MEQHDLKSIIRHVEEEAMHHGLWSPGDTVIVAVSGGPDSVALLHVLHAISLSSTPLRLVCAHVHHGFRPESDQEAAFVGDLAASLGIPVETARIDVRAYMKDSGKGTQEAAREKRYEFLYRTAEKYGAAAIALAHHADDQAETVLMRLLRGSGLSGLAGMRIKRFHQNVKLVRPLLRIYKKDLVRLCEESRYPFMVDASNLEAKYHRNAIRLEVLPYLERYNGRISSALNQLAEVAGTEDDYMDLAAGEAYRSLVRDIDGRLVMDAPSFLGLHVALQRRLIKLILNYLSSDPEIADFTKIELVRRAIAREPVRNWSLDLGGGLTCVAEYGRVSFLPRSPAGQENYIYRLDSMEESELVLTEIGKVLRVKPMHAEEPGAGSGLAPNEAAFDLDRLVFPLTIRSRQPGDRMKIMGLNGSKKVKDIFIDEKIPPSVRSRLPVICDGSENIIWIPHTRRSVHAVVGRHTANILRMKLIDAEKA